MTCVPDEEAGKQRQRSVPCADEEAAEPPSAASMGSRRAQGEPIGSEGLLRRESMLALLDGMEDFIYVSDPTTYEVLFVNRRLRAALGRDPVGGQCYKEFQNLDSPCDFCTNSIILANEGKPHCWDYYNPKLDRHFQITDRIIPWTEGREARFEIAHDITRRKQVERYHILTAEILERLNRPVALTDSLRAVLAAIRASTGCAAAGIRLASGEDFPYFVQDGFPEEFLQEENTLIVRDPQGGICRGPDGEIVLACTCGLVVSGKTDPSHALFSPGGSAWTNDSLPILDLPPEADARLHPRNRCLHEGYASIALIPIRARRQIAGLLHLAHRNRNQFSAETIRLLEGISAHIGEAWIRAQLEEESEKLQARLFQAQKMESVGRLAGGVAHDFNNMLMVISGEAEMAREETGNKELVENSLCEIQKAVKRSADLTRQLLAFARRQTVAPKALDLNETINGMLKMLRRLIGEDIDMVWQPGRNLAPVFMDPSQVDQILVNLCVNARDAIAETGKITVETDNVSFDEAYCVRHAEAMPGNYVMLAVSDNGRGMDAETLGQIFEPFFSTKGANRGTGLGLATVYGVVKQNQGFINVYSEPGHGTTFKIYLPQHADKAVRTTEQKPAAKPQANRETVLLVEDELAILRTTTLLLKRLGYTVIPASTPGEAIRLAREYEGRIDLLVTDVIMPEMNGRDLARNLMSIFPDIKRMFMSGYTANVIAHHGVLDAGVQFIQKPFSGNALAAKIRETLDR